MATKKHKVESKYRDPDSYIKNLKSQIKKSKEGRSSNYHWENPSILEMDSLKSGTLSEVNLKGVVWVRGVVFEKVESLEKDGESIKIKCIGFATKGIN